jgi:hypothetical protein
VEPRVPELQRQHRDVELRLLRHAANTPTFPGICHCCFVTLVTSLYWPPSDLSLARPSLCRPAAAAAPPVRTGGGAGSEQTAILLVARPRMKNLSSS